MKSVLFIAIGIVVIAIVAFGLANSGEGTTAPQEILIKEYEGARLDDLSAFRENSIKGVQRIDQEDYSLKVTGLVGEPFQLNYSQLQEMKHIEKLVTLYCVEGWTAKMLWEGIPLVDLIDRASPLEGASNVIFKSSDGYTTSLKLEYIRERNIIIADKLNGIQLPPAQGFPFIVVAEDKWGYKWARWVEEIHLSDEDTYRGYWEIRGYSEDGSLNKPMFERYNEPESDNGNDPR